MSLDEGADLSVADYADEIQPAIGYCYNCQPYDGGEVVWVQGDEAELEDLFEAHEVPEPLRDQVAALLECRNCGTVLSRGDHVGTYTQEERLYECHWNEWREKYGDELGDFEEHLAKYPFLGLDHPLGRSILAAIPKLPSLRLPAGVWWRARKPEGSELLTPDAMLPPNDGSRAEGRYHHYGQSVFYLSDSQEGALAEVMGGAPGGIAWVIQFEVPAIDRILDLADVEWWERAQRDVLATGLAMLRHTHVPNYEHPWKPEYLIYRFVADCARRHGFAGVRFDSAHGSGVNLVLFDWRAISIKALGRPQIFERGPDSDDLHAKF